MRGHKAKASDSVTRGRGLLEPFLAWARADKVNKLIPPELRAGRVLDIGCGSFPYFLSHTYFQEKYAIDQLTPRSDYRDIEWHTLDLNTNPALPFADSHFSAVTMLAVVEHLDPAKLVEVFKEIHRTLTPGGMVVVTTPAAWSDRILRLMARLRLVSPEEIGEHAYVYTLPLLGWYFGKAGFEMQKNRFGYFEFLLNMWATAEK